MAEQKDKRNKDSLTFSNFGWSWHIEWQASSEFHGHLIDHVIVDIKSPFQRIMVAELSRFGKTLIIDGKIQSTVQDEFIYHETLVHPLLLGLDKIEKVLILGGGEGATLREVLKYKDVKSVTMVDIDKSVIDFAKQYLQEWHQGAFDDKRTRLVISDAYNFVRDEKEIYDAIILDLTDPIKGNTSYMLYTEEFYQLIKSRLSPGGGMVTQATSPSFSLETFTAIFNTIRQVFKFVSASIVHIPSFDGLWGFVYASDKGSPTIFDKDQLEKRIKERINGELRFFDGETNNTLFNIPKHIRKIMQNEKRKSTMENPIYVPA
ncbi:MULTISPECIES: polyamine aminopropyltransferase [Acidianus]|uniref:Polyamine aminopropyltransferase n=1 Tax=Candidatus Acidianus copahuensis TaxID=1160895 RepID=A0A031LLF8_9CREN|nr:MULTISPECIES: polyamine aminopropyltransferase [Acidianus]EZQ03027.1 spermidine synthase [Candidatus Acidianus copahuensis]NON61618.1 polyamine aminopropyltransferase [Acidianus sp. RZ1]